MRVGQCGAVIILALSLLSIASSKLGAVTPFPAGALVLHKANYFDLQNHRMRFLPASGSRYTLSVSASSVRPQRGSLITKPSSRLSLAFPFPFGGRTWDAVYVNLNGNLTFGAPDVTDYPERDTWPDGTMRSLASSLDTHAVDGHVRMIAPFWGLNSAEGTRITASSSPRELIVTWDALRYQSQNEAYSPLGRSVFQVRLSRDGSIEFRYGIVSEKDGIVGIFPGLASNPTTLDRVDLPKHASANPAIDLRRVDVEELGSELRFTLHTAEPVPEQVHDGTFSYRVIVFSGDVAYRLALDVDAKDRTAGASCFLMTADRSATPDDCSVATLIMADAATVKAYLPKVGLRNPRTFSWTAEAAFTAASNGSSNTVSTGNGREVRVAFPMTSGIDFSVPPPAASGAIFEIFSYPFVPKSRQRALKAIYGTLAAEDDLAIVLTDFRIDDIHNHGSSNGLPVVGNRYDGFPETGYAVYGSRTLQRAAGPIYLGPRFAEAPRDEIRTWRNYPFAVGWMAHEMTHRWAAYATWNGTDSQALLDPSRGHWSPLLNTPAVYPVARLFTDMPYTEQSIMGGMHHVERLPDGTMYGAIAPWGAPTGVSALDLYLMGMIDEEDVPDTILVTGSAASASGEHQGIQTVPVRIADIIAAGGPRTPPASEAQHRFTIGIYLLFEEGREHDPDKLVQARGIEAALMQYFSVATGGRMTLSPH